MEAQANLEAVTKLKHRLQRKLESRGFDVTEEDISDEIDDAINFVNNRRGFVSTPDCLYESKFSNIIMKLALASIAKYGAEGEASHNENGISRGYENGGTYPYSLVAQIPPVARTPDMG